MISNELAATEDQEGKVAFIYGLLVFHKDKNKLTASNDTL